MAFTLTTQAREHRLEYSDGVVLVFREFKGDERQRYELELVKLIKGKNSDARYDLLRRQVAAVLLISWAGIAGEDGQTVECTDENKALFFADPESAKYWLLHIANYLSPTKLSTGVIDPSSEEDREPDFFAAR